MSEYWCALIINGVGDEDGQYAFCLGEPDLAGAGYKGVPLLVNYPQNLSARLDPIKVEYDLSGFTFALAAQTPWLALFMRRIYQGDGALVTSISASSTTLEIAYAGSLVAGEYVYLGRETIKLGTLDSTDSYTDTATGQLVSYDVFTGCTRGALGSLAEPHGVSDEDDNRVYGYPELSGRLCEFQEWHEGDEAPQTVWRGLINDIRLNDDDESTVLVDTSDLLSILSSRKLNRRPYQAVTSDEVISKSVGIRPGWLHFSSRLDEATRERLLRFGKTSKGGSNVRLALHVAGALTSGMIQEVSGADAAGTWYGYTTTNSLGQWSYAELGSEIQGDEEGSFSRAKAGQKITEVLCFGQDFVNLHGVYYGCGTSRVDIHHPLHLLLLVLLSSGFNEANSISWDKLGSEWGLAVPERLVDVTGIEQEMARTPDLKVDRLVLGWEGREWSIRDLLDKCLRPLGYYLKQTNQGKIGVGRLVPLMYGPDTPEVDFDKIVEMSESLERRMSTATQKIRADFGLPWGEQSTISFENKGKQGRLWWPESDSVGADFDLTAFQSPDNFGKSAASVYLAWVLQLMWRPIPTQRITIAGRASDHYWPGLTLAVIVASAGQNSDGSEGVLVDRDGARYEGAFIGLVVESEYSPQDGTWTLALWLQNEPLRGLVVAIPVGVPVVGYDSTTGTLTIQRVHEGVDLAPYVGAGSGTFVLCDSLLVPRAWAAPVTFINVLSSDPGSSTIDLVFAQGPSSAGPEVGDYLRFAEYSQQGGDKLFWLYGASDFPRLNTVDPPKWYV